MGLRIKKCGGQKKHLTHPLLACEQALLLRESREVTRDPHAKGDASARVFLASRFSRACSQADPFLLAQNDWSNYPLPRHEALPKNLCVEGYSH